MRDPITVCQLCGCNLFEDACWYCEDGITRWQSDAILAANRRNNLTLALDTAARILDIHTFTEEKCPTK
jgi:hypothetical protein